MNKTILLCQILGLVFGTWAYVDVRLENVKLLKQVRLLEQQRLQEAGKVSFSTATSGDAFCATYFVKSGQ